MEDTGEISHSLAEDIGNHETAAIKANSHDVIPRVPAEEKLRENELRFRAQYKALPIPVYSWQQVDDDFVLIDYNYAAEEITQGNAARLLGEKASVLYQDAPDILEEMWRCYQEHQSFHRQMLYKFRSISDTKHLSVSYGYVPPDIVLVHTEDVSERVLAEEALQELYDELELRVRQRTADLERANATLRAEVARREQAQEEIERSHQRESVLNSLLRISMEDLSLTEQLERALDEILSIPWLPVLPQGAIFLVGEDPERLELQHSRGLGSAFQVACARVDFGTCLCGSAAASKKIQFAARLDERHEISYEGMVPHGHYSVPILSSHKTIGVLVLYLNEGHRQDLEEQTFLEAVAHTLAGIIERKQAEEALQTSERRLRELYQQLEEHSRNLEDRVAIRTREIQQRRQVAESLRGMLTVLNSELPLDEVLDHIAREARRILGSDTSAIYELHEKSGTLVARTVQGSPHGAIVDSGMVAALGKALRNGKPVIVPDVTEDPVGPAWPSEPGCLSIGCGALLAVPLIVKTEVYGSLTLYYSDPRRIPDEEVHLAVAFGDQAALAIENARLREQVTEAAIMEERARLARELHDSVTQALFSMTLLAEAGQRLAANGDLERVRAYLSRLGETSQQSLKEMRLLVYELRPLALENVGLTGALQQRLDAVEARAGVDARLRIEGMIRVPVAMEEDLYRIAEQALNNALKHAAATTVTVRMDCGEERVAVEVVDNGCGFDPASVEDKGGQGLVSMRERANRIGGILTVVSSPGQGTTIRVDVEIPGNARTRR